MEMLSDMQKGEEEGEQKQESEAEDPIKGPDCDLHQFKFHWNWMPSFAGEPWPNSGMHLSATPYGRGKQSHKQPLLP